MKQQYRRFIATAMVAASLIFPAGCCIPFRGKADSDASMRGLAYGTSYDYNRGKLRADKVIDLTIREIRDKDNVHYAIQSYTCHNVPFVPSDANRTNIENQLILVIKTPMETGEGVDLEHQLFLQHGFFLQPAQRDGLSRQIYKASIPSQTGDLSHSMEIYHNGKFFPLETQ